MCYRIKYVNAKAKANIDILHIFICLYRIRQKHIFFSLLFSWKHIQYTYADNVENSVTE